MLRKIFITLSITVSCLVLAPVAASAKSGLDVVKDETISKPAENAGKQAKRAFVGPATSAADRSWSSDKTTRESVAMAAERARSAR